MKFFEEWIGKWMPTPPAPAAGSSESALYFNGQGTLCKRGPGGAEISVEGGGAGSSALYDSGWINAITGNGWINYDANTYDSIQYRKIGNVVYIKGFIRAGNTAVGTTIFILPTGFRPTLTSHVVTTADNGAAARFNVFPDGRVAINAAFSAGWTTFGYVSFPVDSISPGIQPADSGWIALPGSGNVNAYGGGYQTPQYRKVGDRVYLRGLLRWLGGNGYAENVLAALPSGFFPPANVIFGVNTQQGNQRINIYSNGGVNLLGTLNNQDYISLDGVDFSITT